jgi:hypothetical protein
MRFSMIFRHSIIIVLSFALCFNGMAQTYEPKITLASPEATSLGNYGNTSVNLYTGQPATEVPLFEANLATRFTLPLKLTYASNGLRPNEEASNVGLGWTLQGGGTIVRTIRGMDDLYHGGGAIGYTSLGITPDTWWYNYYTSGIVWENDNLVAQGLVDFEPDIFIASFLGRSIKFILKMKSQNNGQIGCILLEKSDLKIRVISNTGSLGQYRDDIGFEITDEAGIRYTFRTTEHSTTRSYSAQCSASPSGTGSCPIPTLLNNPTEAADINTTMAWQLDLIEFPNHEQVTFEYDSYRNGKVYSSQSQSMYSENKVTESSYPPDIDNSGTTPASIPIRQSIAQTGILHAYLKKVTGPFGSVTFETSDRADMDRANDNYFAWFPAGERLNPQKVDKIILKNSAQNVVKTFKLNYGYFNASSTPAPLYQRLKLTAVNEIDATNAVNKSFTFYYDESSSLPAKNTVDIDHWGYFNSKGNLGKQLHLIPTHMSCQSDIYPKLVLLPGADRETNEPATRLAQLSKIVYPTGGETNFEWEQNTYRIKKSDQITIDKNNGSYYVNNPYRIYKTLSGCSYLIGDFPGTSIEQEFTITETQTVVFNISMGCVPSHGSCTYNNAFEDKPYVKVLDASGTGPHYVYGGVNEYRTNNMQWVSRSVSVNLTPGTYKVIVYKLWDGFCGGCDYSFINIPPITNPNELITKNAGGLRIRSIITKDNTGAPDIVRNYKYQTTIDNQTTTSGKLFPFISYTSTYLSYGRQNSRYYHFAFGTPQLTLASAAQGNYIGYDVVDEEFSTGNQQYKLRHTFKNFTSDIFTSNDVPNLPDYRWQNLAGSLQKQESIDKNNVTVKDQVNEYYAENPEVAFAVKNTIVALPSTTRSVVAQYRVFQTFDNIRKTTEQLYTSGTPVKTETEYKYGGNGHNLLVEKITKNSKGETIDQKLKYPADVTLSGTAETARLKLIDKKQINEVVLESVLKNNTPIKAVQKNFEYDVNNDLVNLKEVNTQEGSAPLERNILFEGYDARGNIKQYTSRDGIHRSYIYDYLLQLPIAEVKGAVQNDIAFTSFEAEGTGNWTISSTGRNTGGITGAKSYPLSNGAIQKANLNTGAVYIVSYWSTGGACSVSGTTGNPEQGRTITINGVTYTYFQHRVTATATVTVSGGVTIDELRLYPANAQMTTFTYDPFIGTTSQCDANNRIVYYQYDSFGRLVITKDQDGNIIKTLDYHYKQ